MKGNQLKTAIENQLCDEHSTLLGDIVLRASDRYVHVISFQPLDVRLAMRNEFVVLPEPRVDADFVKEEFRSFPTIDMSRQGEIIESEGFWNITSATQNAAEHLRQETYAWMGKQLQQRREVGEDFTDYPTSMFWTFHALDGERLQEHAWGRARGGELLWLRLPRTRVLLFDGDAWDELRNDHIITNITSKLMNSSFEFEPFQPAGPKMAKLFDFSESKHIQGVVSYLLESDLIGVSELPDAPIWLYE
jgi:hypothetical protein